MAPKLGLQGLTVTAPHTAAVLSACDTQDALVRQIGAANALVRRKDVSPARWDATHTDAMAIADALEESLGGQGTLRGKNVLILGSTDAARALAFGVKARGAEVLICGQRAERVAKLSAATGAKSVLMEDLTADLEVSIVVNTTPAGKGPKAQKCPWKAERFPNASLIVDIGYNPEEAAFLRAARAGRPPDHGRTGPLHRSGGTAI